jgi:hypothetical protein
MQKSRERIARRERKMQVREFSILRGLILHRYLETVAKLSRQGTYHSVNRSDRAGEEA